MSPVLESGGSGSGVFDAIYARGAPPADGWLQALLDVEAALARALERAGLAPAGSGAAVTSACVAADFDPAALGTGLAGNPVPGLARELAARVGDPAARAVHRGATSQDIIDTAMMLLARAGIDRVLGSLAVAADAAAHLAAGHRDTIMTGRTLLQQAVPVTFGLVAAGWLAALDEARSGLTAVRDSRLAVQFGGAAGTLAALGGDGPRVAALLASELGLEVPLLPWHTDRLRVFDVAAALARACAALGKLARDVTLLAQAELGEVRLGEQGGGSSTMPHKHNPVAAIAVLGCSRQAPGLLATLLASAEQEFQRAAGAWHAEWAPFTTLLRLTGSAAAWAAALLSSLIPDGPRMSANLAAAKGLPLAEHVAALLSGALGRAAAHDLVAEASTRAEAAGLPLRDVLLSVPSFADRLAAAGVSAEQVESALEPSGYLGAAQVFIDAALDAHADAGGT